MGVSAEDRSKWERQVVGLLAAESDDLGDEEWRSSVREHADHRRETLGIPPLREWWEDRPEAKFHELARSRGLLL